MSNNSKPFNKGNKLPITKKPVKGIQLGPQGTQSGTHRTKGY